MLKIHTNLLLLIITLSFSTFSFAQPSSKPLTIGKTDQLHSNILNEDRSINIYFPEGYQQNDTLKYPVIYVLDGGIDEDFLHIAGIVRYYTQPWIARFPASIVIGIEGNMRRRDFTFAVSNTDFIEKEGFKKSSFPQHGGSENYLNFLEKELLPYIEKTYQTSHRTIIGESLAGLFASEVLLKRPELFDNYVIISPSLWWDEQSLLRNGKQLLAANIKKHVNIYVGTPNKEEDERMFKDAERLYETLRNNEKITATFDYIPDELHSTVIHQAVFNAFKKLYPAAQSSN